MMSEQRYLCDEMLHRLGRWLRAAGYDTAIAEVGAPDGELLHQALNEGRMLLTRDRHLAHTGESSGKVLLLQQNTLNDLVAELTGRCDIDWLLSPFSRCLECNTPLVPADDAQRKHLPEGALSISSEARYCPCCDKLYWEGSHVRRMRHTLENFSRGEWSVADD